MAFLTRSELMRPLEARFSIRDLLLEPELRQAIVARCFVVGLLVRLRRRVGSSSVMVVIKEMQRRYNLGRMMTSVRRNK